MGDDAARIAAAFGRVLRGAGLAVTTDSTLLYGRALAALGWTGRDDVYWAGRAVFVHRPEQVERYDRSFASMFDVAGETAADGTYGTPGRPQEVVAAVDESDPAGGAGGAAPDLSDLGEAATVIPIRFSRAEVLRHRDFALYTTQEHAEARRLMTDLRLVAAHRVSRRTRPARRGARLDVRRTVRHALRTDGEPVVRFRRARTTRPRRLVVLCDVSGSMEAYSRAMLRFLHTAVVGMGPRACEAFALGTRLTRVTRELASRDPDAALAAAARRVVDWSGGTRLGDGLRAFNDAWGVRGPARGAVVVIVSDGWDRGDPELLAREMARLGRVAHRVIWVNPLKASPGYAPVTRGMAAALPFVDEFLEGHSLATLESLVEVIAR